jgi:hypothetical protein
MKLVVPEEVDHIIKVTGPRPFAERADLLGEDFFIAIAADSDRAFRGIRIRMRDGAIEGRQYQYFVRRQVKLDSGQVSRRRRYRAAIKNSPLLGWAVATVPEDFEMELIGRKLRYRSARTP